ncbi:tol-pal system-associated acyl-CoA thioesterase [Ideonella sp.]|uniref:tol-pal system-associated acyl-CoA thioesterase n=1 Tax=Ideonella sp. TaxID=1929293 RepID=UPI002B4609CB|nr:tol-pal system-associated acyl-CoA thioesterase [Ideonella sp.]HJV70802.1 tol-pal system-associated acyl-CoA thioesterase [Ideonella sp.]
MSLPRAARFSHLLRVYWEDTDAGGIVFYANYLKFFERARTEWLRSAGHGQQAMVEATGAMFVVTDSRLRYLRPARLDDELLITVEPVEIGRARMLVKQQAWCGEVLLCEGEIAIACVDRGTFRPRRIPNDILDKLPA